MRSLQTRFLGVISYDEDAELEFPRGLPGFELLRRFVAARVPGDDPLIFLQSLEDPALCFLTCPISAIDASYRLDVAAEDLASIGLSGGVPPVAGEDVLCLTMLSVRQNGASANLLAPLIVNLRNRKAVQAISLDGNYSHQHSLEPAGACVCS